LVSSATGYANVPPGTVFGEEEECLPMCGPRFAGASPDLSHIVLSSQVPLASGVSGPALYEWSNGRLAWVDVLPESEEPAESAKVGFQNNPARHAVSDDGSRIVWSGTAEEHAEHLEHLYLRDIAKKQTVQLDAVQGGSGYGFSKPIFQAASSDGSTVFFTDQQHLTVNAPGKQPGHSLYECQIVEVEGRLRCNLFDLTPANEAEENNVEGVLGTSDDGSWVYFVATGLFAKGAMPGNCAGGFAPRGSTCNLYVWHDGTTRLVAVLSEEDYADWAPGNQGDLQHIWARVSPDGRWLAFMSQRQLTGYDSRDAVSGEPDQEVYLYDAAGEGGKGRLLCASCNPTGARPVGVEPGVEDKNAHLVAGPAFLPVNLWFAATIPAWTPTIQSHSFYQSRYLSDSGRLFFDSHDALVPQDVNGNQDVYEYEPAGVGGCTGVSSQFSVRSGGCVGLVSSGGAPGESAFMDASQTGADVFFLTYGKLSTADFDTALDMYDAHECTASSPCFAQPPVQPPPCVTGDSCKAAPTPQPSAFGAPASATFAGQGNVTVSSRSSAGATPKGLSRARKLARALKACHRVKKRRRRAACEKLARKRLARGVMARTGNASGKASG
jgi:hypothetical protein